MLLTSLRRMAPTLSQCLLCLGLFFSASLWASGLQVAPVGLSLAPADKAGIFTLSNTGAAPLNAQLRIFQWTQNEQGEDVLTPSDDLIASPPMLALPVNGSQEVRIIRAQVAGKAEAHYRLIVDELPTPSATPRKGLSIALRYSIPIFINAQDRPEVVLQWGAKTTADGKTLLSIHNPGVERAQIARIWLQSQGQEAKALNYGLFGYVLPGKTIQREVNISLAQLKAAQTTLMAVINDRESTVTLGD